MARLLILNGPNLNLLGQREKGIYGNATLKDIENSSRSLAKSLGHELDFRQSNTEGEIVDWIQEAGKGEYDGIIINAAAYTHTSVAIHDALKAIHLPKIEIHLSNIFAREPFRHHSYVSPVADGIICGFGENSYLLAIEALNRILEKG